MTVQTAQQFGYDAARDAYRQWDAYGQTVPRDRAQEAVWYGWIDLEARLTAAGLTEDDDHLWAAAGDAYRTEAEARFGADYVMVGQ